MTQDEVFDAAAAILSRPVTPATSEELARILDGQPRRIAGLIWEAFIIAVAE